MVYIVVMKNWDVEYTDEFEDWWNQLSESEQESIIASVGLLEACGPNLRFPHSSGITTSRHDHMRTAMRMAYSHHRAIEHWRPGVVKAFLAPR